MRVKYFLYKLLFVLILILAVVGSVYYFLTEFKIEKVDVQGIEFSNREAVVRYVTDRFLGDNSHYLTNRFKEKQVDSIPFVDAIAVSSPSHHEIVITVYEKMILGYLEYEGEYYYFDKDGYAAVQLSSQLDNALMVSGLDIPYVKQDEKIPVSDTKILAGILTVAKLIRKNNYSAELLYVKPDGGIVVYFGSIRVDFGSKYDYIEDKFSLLSQFFEMLAGESGVIDMSGDSDTYVFTRDESGVSGFPFEEELG